METQQIINKIDSLWDNHNLVSLKELSQGTKKTQIKIITITYKENDKVLTHKYFLNNNDYTDYRKQLLNQLGIGKK